LLGFTQLDYQKNTDMREGLSVPREVENMYYEKLKENM
jgi:hypothetical protein